MLKKKMIKATKRKKYAMLCCVCVYLFSYLQDHQKCLFLYWWLGVNSEPPTPSPSSSSSPPPYNCWEYLINSSLRFPANKTSSSCSWTIGWILKERLLEQVFRCKDRKEREQGWKRTHCPGAFREGVAWDICVTPNRMPSNKAIRVVSIN